VTIASQKSLGIMHFFAGVVVSVIASITQYHALFNIFMLLIA
jgi:hypothetical protein